MHVLDVAENSVAAGAKLVHITLEADAARDLLALTIEDDGCNRHAPDHAEGPHERVGSGCDSHVSLIKRCQG